MLPPSTTLQFNAVAPLTATVWRPYSWAHPGLRTQINRGSWLSRQLTTPAGADEPDWTLADAWVDGCLAQGLQPLALLTDDPARPFGPFDAAGWGAYCGTVAQRFAGRVKYYEVGNEVDTEGSWLFDGNAGGATAGLAWRAAVDAIAAVDPSATVICGSFQSIWPTGHGLQTLAGALRSFGAVPSDLAIHAYPTPAQVGLVPRMIERVRGACAAYAKGDPRLWISEWSLWPAQFSRMTASAQGAFLKTMLRHFRDAEVFASLHYNFDDPNGFGWVDQKAGKTIWNDAVYAVYGKAAATATL
jgi:hypothetical protein